MSPHLGGTTRAILACLALLLGAAPPVAARPKVTKAKAMRRFLIVGDGTLGIRSTKNRHRFAGRFRRRSGTYIERALRRIDRVIGVPAGDATGRVSLRLIEVLSFLQSRLKGGWLIVSSGYRSPAYNRMLREKGRTVAKASLHQYGMAVDIRIVGRKAKPLWRFARRHRVGGAGYYGGKWIHVDTGPVRAWTQGTANVRKGLSTDNKRIILVPGYDRYRAGERMRLRFARMTAYPIGVRPELALEQKRGETWRAVTKATATMPAAARRDRRCNHFAQLEQMADVGYALPKDLLPGRYRLRASFCGKKWPAMPDAITSYEIVVARR